MKNSIITAILFFFACAPAYCGKSIIITSDTQFEYARLLFSQEDYSSALTEYKRFVHFFSEEEQAEKANFMVGECLLKLGKIKQAQKIFYDHINKYRGSSLSTEAYLRVATCHEKQGELAQAAAALKALADISSDKAVKDKAKYRAAWIYVDAMQTSKALKTFNEIEEKDKYKVDTIAPDLEAIENSRYKSPTLAGTLALVPGAGHVYCERYKDAFISFVINSLLTYAAYEAFDNDQNALGGILTFVEAGFYTGNIYSAVGCAKKHNEHKKEGLINDLKKRTSLQLSTHGKDKHPMLTLKYTF